MTLREAKEALNKINRECAIEAMNKNWTRAKELNEQAIELQNRINELMYFKQR